MSEMKIVPHCWFGNTEDAEERFGFGSTEWAEAFIAPKTCMLMHGHEGPASFESDSYSLAAALRRVDRAARNDERKKIAEDNAGYAFERELNEP